MVRFNSIIMVNLLYFISEDLEILVFYLYIKVCFRESIEYNVLE